MSASIVVVARVSPVPSNCMWLGKVTWVHVDNEDSVSSLGTDFEWAACSIRTTVIVPVAIVGASHGSDKLPKVPNHP